MEFLSDNDDSNSMIIDNNESNSESTIIDQNESLNNISDSDIIFNDVNRTDNNNNNNNNQIIPFTNEGNQYLDLTGNEDWFVQVLVEGNVNDNSITYYGDENLREMRFMMQTGLDAQRRMFEEEKAKSPFNNLIKIGSEGGGDQVYTIYRRPNTNVGIKILENNNNQNSNNNITAIPTALAKLPSSRPVISTPPRRSTPFDRSSPPVSAVKVNPGSLPSTAKRIVQLGERKQQQQQQQQQQQPVQQQVQQVQQQVQQVQQPSTLPRVYSINFSIFGHVLGLLREYPILSINDLASLPTTTISRVYSGVLKFVSKRYGAEKVKALSNNKIPSKMRLVMDNNTPLKCFVEDKLLSIDQDRNVRANLIGSILDNYTKSHSVIFDNTNMGLISTMLMFLFIQFRKHNVTPYNQNTFNPNYSFEFESNPNKNVGNILGFNFTLKYNFYNADKQIKSIDMGTERAFLDMADALQSVFEFQRAMEYRVLQAKK